MISTDDTTRRAIKEMQKLDAILEQAQAEEWAARHAAEQRHLMLSKEIKSEACSSCTDVPQKLFHKLIANITVAEPAMTDNCLGPEATSSRTLTVQNTDVAEAAENNSTETLTREQSEGSRTKTDPELGQKEAQHFVSRNIKLACDGQGTGTLALTEEERERLDKLLENLDKADTIPDDSQEHAGYTFSADMLQTIQSIDSKLDAMGAVANIGKDSHQSQLDSHGLTRRRINEINRTLTTLRQMNNQEIEPLDDVSLQLLIGQYTAPQTANSKTVNSDGDSSNEVIGSQVTISNLVQEARASMPLFKFKHTQPNDNATSTIN